MGVGALDWLQAIVLGLVQGLTEFLPISSSAHLRVVSTLGWGTDAGASFTAVSQIGTELAVLIYYAKTIGPLIGMWFKGLVSAQARRTEEYRIAWYVIAGSVPITVLGVLFQDQIKTSLRNLWITATVMIVFAVILAVSDELGKQLRSKLTLKDSIIMGSAQAMALIPGVSRSGGTLTAGMFLNLERKAATDYSFLLALPAVFGAGIFSLKDIGDKTGPGPHPSVAQMIVATVIAFVVGYATIAWLLRYVAKHSYSIFVWYRIVLGAVLMVLLATNTIPAT
jgi:undecaprenyl-diphosphatase